MHRFMNRRNFALGAGLLLGGMGTQMGRKALAQDYERRDPNPQYNPFHTEPVHPRLVERWDNASGTLQPPGGVLDDQNPFSANPSFRFQFDQAGTETLFRYENPNGLAIGLYHVYTVLKADRLIGPLSMKIDINYRDGTFYTLNEVIEFNRSRFDWSTFVIEFGESDGEAAPITAVEGAITLGGTGRVWVGAAEIVNLGLSALHTYFARDTFGPGN